MVPIDFLMKFLLTYKDQLKFEDSKGAGKLQNPTATISSFTYDELENLIKESREFEELEVEEKYKLFWMDVQTVSHSILKNFSRPTEVQNVKVSTIASKQYYFEVVKSFEGKTPE